jgi:hypothetical protein
MSMVFAGFMQARREERLLEEEREAERKAEERAFEQKKELLGLEDYFDQKREDREFSQNVQAAAEVLGLEGDDVAKVAPFVRTLGVDGTVEAFNDGGLNVESGTTTNIAPEQIGSMLVNINEQYDLPEGHLYTMADIESGFDPLAQNDNSSAGGLMQQTDANADQYGVADRFDPVESAIGAAKAAVSHRETLRAALGRNPTGAELYLAHQQGAGGAPALLSNPNANVLDVLTTAYNGDRDKARNAIRDNGGSLDMTAGQFASIWTQEYNRRRSTYDPSAFSDTQTTKVAPEGFTLNDAQPDEESQESPLGFQMSGLGFGETGEEEGAGAAFDIGQGMEQGKGVLPSLDMGVQLDREVDGPGMTIREPAEVSLSTGQSEFNPEDYAGMDASELQVLINTTDDPQSKANLQRVYDAKQAVQGANFNPEEYASKPASELRALIAVTDDPEKRAVLESMLAAQQEGFKPEKYVDMPLPQLDALINSTQDTQFRADLQRVYDAKQEVQTDDFNPIDYAGMDLVELEVAIATTKDPQLKANLQGVYEARKAAEQGSSDFEAEKYIKMDLPALGALISVTEDEELKTNLQRVYDAKQEANSGMDLGETPLALEYTDSSGEVRITSVLRDNNSGDYFTQATRRRISQDAAIDATPMAQITGLNEEIARASPELGPLGEAQNALLNMMSTAETLNKIAGRSPTVLTTSGNFGPQILTRLRSEFNAINNLYLSGATDREIYAAINERAEGIAGASRDAALFNAGVLRFAFNYARTGLGQEGVGLSNKDFQNALQIVSSGENFDEFSDNLRQRVVEGVDNVEFIRRGVVQDPLVTGILRMPGGRNRLKASVLTETPKWIESRGMSDVYDWAQGEQEQLTQGTGGSQTTQGPRGNQPATPTGGTGGPAERSDADIIQKFTDDGFAANARADMEAFAESGDVEGQRNLLKGLAGQLGVSPESLRGTVFNGMEIPEATE